MPLKRLVSAVLVLVFAASTALAAPPDAPSRLRVNDIDAPVGTPAGVYFGWQVNDPDPGESQSACQILVSSSESKLADGDGDVWDSGEIDSRLQNHVRFAGHALSADRRYLWKVRTWDKDGAPGPYSAPSSFTVGLLANENWAGASWIRRDSTDKDDYTCYRKKLSLTAKPVARATVYVSGTHHYALHLNGQLVGKGQAYQYPQYQYYRAYDITSLLTAGADNQFALFNHWFGGGQGRPAGERGIILKAVIHYTDGTKTELGTDSTWLQSRANAWVLTDLADRNRGEGVGYVECIDARELRPAWTTLAFDDSSWSPATAYGSTASVSGTLTPDLTRIEETVIAPASITLKSDGKYVIDLGKVYAGMPRIRFSGGTAGTTVTLRGGYGLDSSGEIPAGTKAQSTLMEYRAILNGGSFTFEPVEYLGMRYVQIDNAPMPLTADNFSFVVRHTSLDDNASAFESSDATLNAVWALMKHSLSVCAQEEFVDTPTREKGGFLGDSVLQSTVAMPVLGERALTQRTLQEFLRSMDQHWSKPDDRGRMNAVYPNNDGARDIPDFTQAFLPWAWAYYTETGDRTFLAKYYFHLKSIADYVARHTDATTGLVTKLTGGKGPYQYGIVDWPASMRYGYDMATDARTVINGWAYADFSILSQIAAEMRDHTDRDAYQAKALALADAINSKLRNSGGLYIDGLRADGTPSPHVSQHANLFPLALGIVPEESRAAVTERVKADGMRVGMVTVNWLVRALGESKQGPALLSLYTDATRPGWAQSLSRGATATWESWDADTTGQSLSHAWGASGLEGYYRYILGVRPLKPQYEEVLIQPLDFTNKLNWAKGKITTDRGPIAVHWKSSAGSYTLHVDIPVNITARIAVPRGTGANPGVTLDGAPVPFTTDGDTLVIADVGSGRHTLIRQDTAPDAPVVETSPAVLPQTTFANLRAGKPQTVVTYGTSLTVTGAWPKAMHDYFDRHFPGQITFVNAAQSGQHSNWGLENLRQRVLDKHPDLVFLEFAVNDAATKHGISLEKCRANLDAMVHTLRKQNPRIDIVLQTMNPAWDSPASAPKRYAGDRPNLADYYAVYRDYARANHLPLVDHYPVWASLLQAEPERFHALVPDGIHPGESGSLAITWTALQAVLEDARKPDLSILDHGAVGDGKTLNTRALQAAIDSAHASGGGTVVVPSGVFVSGALFLKPGVNLRLEKDAVLRASTDVAAHFPPRRTRIEGHFEDNFTPAFINADHCDGLRITGGGTLDGDGRPLWDAFWKLRRASEDPKGFSNLTIPRARLALIENSRDVVIDGVTFKDSQFWNLHLYRCRDVLVQNTRFVVPDDYKQAPSSDAIDVDSSQGVTIRACFFSVTDDCIALKGSKGPFALDDQDSPPVERVRISDCVFKRGHAALTLGSEATVVRDVVLENSRVLNAMPVLNLKLRTDTPQHYENIHLRDLALDSSGGSLISARPWTQYADLQGQTPPRSVVHDITLSRIRGRFGSLGDIQGIRGQTDISAITFNDIDLKLKSERLKTREVRDLNFNNVILNGSLLPSGPTN